MIFFRGFEHERIMLAAIEVDEEDVNVEGVFGIAKLSENASLPTIDVYDLTPGHFKTSFGIIQEVIKAGEIETPYGVIKTADGIMYRLDSEIDFPVLPEMVEDIEDSDEWSAYDVFAIICPPTRDVHYKIGCETYLDTYYTGIDMEKLKSEFKESKLEDITFNGFNENEVMEFTLDSDGDSKKFQISAFLRTGYRGVYIPKIEIDESINIQEAQKIVDILLRNKKIEFDNDMEIKFEEGIIMNFHGMNISVVQSTKDKVEKLIEMTQKCMNSPEGEFIGLDMYIEENKGNTEEELSKEDLKPNIFQRIFGGKDNGER